MDNPVFYPLLLRRLSQNVIYEAHLPVIQIGRERQRCHICFPEVAQISRLHAEFAFREGFWQLRDMNSVNGTQINGVRLVPGKWYPLMAGDRIALSQKEVLIFETDKTLVDSLGLSVVQIGEGTVPAANPVGNFPIAPLSSGIAPPAPVSARPAMVTPPPTPSVAAPTMAPPPPMPAASQRPPTASAPTMVPPSAKGSQPPAPRKKGGLFGIFGGRREKEKEQPSVQADDVQFRAAAPASLNPGEYFLVKVMMYREDDYARADREEKALADRVKAASSGIFKAKHQEVFRVCLQSPDVDLGTQSQELCWNGKFASGDFEIFLPEGFSARQLRITGRVYSGISVITDLKLILQVESAKQQDVVFEKCRLRSAFISYASQDRAKVVARIQGIQLSRPDMDLFFDAESLRRGEQWEARLYREIQSRDLFYLFWSRNAANSEWVGKELAFALAHKGAGAIEPVPLEEPSICPPPVSLQDRHFNDWTLRYLTGER